MQYPPLLENLEAAEYRSFFEATYCREPVNTFDGISVRFRKRDFNHCFFESVKSKDDTFSQIRAERLLWIKAALQDPYSKRRIRWNGKKQAYDKSRRVVLVKDNYIVVILLKNDKEADFITAYVANKKYTLDKILKSPKWT